MLKLYGLMEIMYAAAPRTDQPQQAAAQMPADDLPF